MLLFLLTVFVVAVTGAVVHQRGHYFAMRRLKVEPEMVYVLPPYSFRLCPSGHAVHGHFLEQFGVYQRVIVLASGLYFQLGYGLTLCTVGVWFTPGQSLVLAVPMLVATVLWWVLPGASMSMLVNRPGIPFAAVAGVFLLTFGRNGDSFFGNLMVAAFVPLLEATLGAIPGFSRRSDGRRIQELLSDKR